MLVTRMSTNLTKIPIPANRESITHEPDDVQGKWSASFPDALSYKSQGGGSVPADFRWRSSPKQWQEELTPESLERRQRFLREEQATSPAKQLPASEHK